MATDRSSQSPSRGLSHVTCKVMMMMVVVVARVLRQGTLVIRTEQRDLARPLAPGAQYMVPRSRTGLRICVREIHLGAGVGRGNQGPQPGP